jgi:hypothetical protein
MATQLNELVVQTLHTLRTKSFRELETLPSVTNETVKVGKKTVHVAIWMDRLAPDLVRVMVQAYRHYLLGTGMMSADGFHMTRSGEISPVTEEERCDFS